MIDPVVIDFAVRGLAEVGRSFESVQQRIDRLEKASTRSTEQGSKTRVRAAQDETRQREKAVASVSRAVERAERQQTREAEAEARRRQQIVRRSSEMAGRVASEAARADARLEADKTRALEREEERRMRIRIRSSEMAGRAAARQAAEELAAQNRAQGVWANRGRRIGGIITGGVGRTLGGAASIAGATLGIGGGMLLADAARNEMSAHKAAQLIVNAVTTGGTSPPGATVGAILGKASQVARENGLSKDEVAQAGLAYSRSAAGGDFAGVMGNMGFFAKMHNVTGADMSDLATSAGMLQSQNPALGGANNGAMQQMLLDVLNQTHLGSLSMPEVAKMAGVVGSGRGAFGGNQGDNQRKLLGLAQLVAPETDPLEAGTMIKDFATEGQKHFKALGKLGVKYNSRGEMVDIGQTIDAVLTGSGGNQGKILEAFGSDRGAKLFAHLNPVFNDAGGGDAGLAAVHKMVDPFLAGGGMTGADLEKRNTETLNDPANKLTRAFEEIKDVLGNALEPQLEHFANDTLPKLIPKFEAVIDAAANFASWFADNPIKGIGAVIAAAVAKDLASAGISAAAEAGIAAIMKRIAGAAGAGTPSVPSLPGAGGPAGGAAGVVGSVAQGAGVVGMLTNIATGGDQKLLSRQLTDDPKQDPSKLEFWKSLPDDAKKKIKEIGADPMKFLMGGDPALAPSTGGGGGGGGAKAATGDVVAFTSALQDATKKIEAMSGAAGGALANNDPKRNVSIANRPVQ